MQCKSFDLDHVWCGIKLVSSFRVCGIMALLVPEARPQTPVRLRRTSRGSRPEEATLGDTFCVETKVLAVLEPAALPRSVHTVYVLSDQIGDAAYRVHNKSKVAYKSSAQLRDRQRARTLPQK